MSTAYYRVQEWAGQIRIEESSDGNAVSILCTHGETKELEVFTTREVAPRVLLALADREDGAVCKHVGGASGCVFLATRGEDLPSDMQVISEHGELFTIAQVKAMTDSKEKE